MNRLTDEKIDEFIKSKFKNDNQISDKANSVFLNFNPKHYNDQFRNTSAEHAENNNEQTVKHEIKDKSNNTDKKIIEVNFYQKLNRILSVAAVSLTVVLVGGSVLYFNKGGKIGLNNQPQVITYNQKTLVQNEKMEVSNEKVLKEVENGFVKAYMLGKRDIGINLTSEYWNEYGNEFTSTDCYKVANITENVSDIFVGEISGSGLPYVFLLMEDETVQYVDLHCYTNNVFYFEATKLEGLYDVVELEQKTRKFSYSNTDYKYVNAIRSDGLRKEIEIGEVNDWYDNVIKNFDNLNKKYIEAHNKTSIPDDGKGDYTVDNITYLQVNGEYRYAYYLKDGKFYRVEKSSAKEECLADGCSGYTLDNSDGRISVLLNKDYIIYENDKNIIYNENDVDRSGRQIAEKSSDGIVLESRENGNLILMLEIGQLEKMGISQNETRIRENVRYNIYGLGENIYNSKINKNVADVKVFTIGNVAPDDTLSIIYAKKDDTIVCIDLIDAIKFSDLHRTRLVLKGSSNVEEFKSDFVYEEKDGAQVVKYVTVFTIERVTNDIYNNREINYNNY